MTTRSSKEQFDANAGKYAVSDVHRSGPSLPVLLELARPVQSDQSLDVATGTGHTALAVARLVAKSVGIDIAPKMLEQARRLAAEQGVSNCEFVEGSAEKIPMGDGQFTLVTARHAPHHFHHVPLFFRKSGGCCWRTGDLSWLTRSRQPPKYLIGWTIGNARGIRRILCSVPSSNGVKR